MKSVYYVKYHIPLPYYFPNTQTQTQSQSQVEVKK
jgi:hypothetical protein